MLKKKKKNYETGHATRNLNLPLKYKVYPKIKYFQMVKLITLTQTCQLTKDKEVNTYINIRYDFRLFHLITVPLNTQGKFSSINLFAA